MQVVATANHADDALDYVKGNPVDVVISDVNMPDKTGLEMIREMKELLQIPIISCCLVIRSLSTLKKP